MPWVFLVIVLGYVEPVKLCHKMISLNLFWHVSLIRTSYQWMQNMTLHSALLHVTVLNHSVRLYLINPRLKPYSLCFHTLQTYTTLPYSKLAL